MYEYLRVDRCDVQSLQEAQARLHWVPQVHAAGAGGRPALHALERQYILAGRGRHARHLADRGLCHLFGVRRRKFETGNIIKFVHACFIINWMYLYLITHFCRQIIDYHLMSNVSVRVIICLCYPVLLLICLIKDLKLLAPCSTISNVCTLAGLVLIFFYLIEDDVVVDKNHFKLKGILEIPIFIGITLYALEAVGVVREYTGEGGSRLRTLTRVDMSLVCTDAGTRVQHGETPAVHGDLWTLQHRHVYHCYDILTIGYLRLSQVRY